MGYERPDQTSAIMPRYKNGKELIAGDITNTLKNKHQEKLTQKSLFFNL